ncbi:MAG: trehalose-phosphatase [Planctomycetota bacterium]
MSSLDARLDELARSASLLVATDYDGTLAPIVEDPAAAVPHREALVALASLCELPDTHVAIVSGRSLNDLARLSGAPEGVRLVGSHGSEFDVGFADSLDAEATALRRSILAELETIAARAPGLAVEPKPAGAAFHWRRADAAAARQAEQAVLDGPCSVEGVHVKRGKCVLELSVVGTDKGQALERLRHGAGAAATLFVGDDLTDEDAFARLRGPDLGIKVGSGETRAPFRVDDPVDVARVLARLGERRREWLFDRGAPPIEQHALLSDQRTCALVSPTGRINWFCAPRADSPALFAELLGGANAGYFAVEPYDGGAPLSQHYEAETLALRTAWRHFSTVDYLDCSQGRPNQRAGRVDLLRVIEGSGRLRIEFAPRLDFGRQATRLERTERGLRVLDTFSGLELLTDGIDWRIEERGAHQSAIGDVDLGQAPVVLDLRWGGDAGQRVDEPRRRRETAEHWNQWAARLRLPPVATQLVRRSALTLRALTHAPTGAVLAAATTSLPEGLGGVRNWDYRYTWLRDAAMSVQALARLGSIDEGMAYLDWVLGVLDDVEGPESLRPLYDVAGRDLGSEAEIRELAGYAGSRPVRVGNAAASQVQLDVFGPIADLVLTLAEQGAPLSATHWGLIEGLVQAVERRWQQPDHGIWEIRAATRHHVFSKLMCWQTVDRAIRLGEQHFDRDAKGWHGLRAAIRHELLERGWNVEREAYTAAYGARDLDASVLWIGLSGCLEAGDERYAKTVDAIAEELRAGSTVYRYRIDDGLPGDEGGFHLLTSWLIDAYHVLGRRDEARELFDDLCGFAGATGLLPEQVDPRTGRALGNHPQAYSHLGLVNNALRLAADEGSR